MKMFAIDGQRFCVPHHCAIEAHNNIVQARLPYRDIRFCDNYVAFDVPPGFEHLYWAIFRSGFSWREGKLLGVVLADFPPDIFFPS